MSLLNAHDLTVSDIRMLRYLLSTDLLAFTRFFFRQREGHKLIIGQHHRVVAETLQKVIDGEIDRLIINVPPGYTKTEMAVISLMGYGLATHKQSRFLHLSYSDSLAMGNSATTKRLMQSEMFQLLFPMKLLDDAKSKKKWWNDSNGGCYATATGGQVTGFRAGFMIPDAFSGMLIIDDPLKPIDARSTLKRNQINDDYNNTVKSRLALETIPVVLIMQRLHDTDLAGYLLRGGSGEKWYHLNLPVLIDNSKSYPKKYTHGISIDHGLPDGPLWDAKHNLKQIETLKVSHPYTYASQYDQNPKPIGNIIFHEDWWNYYSTEVLPSFDMVAIYVDTAQKIKQSHDYSVFQIWGRSEGKIYLIDQIRGKWESPDLLRKSKLFIIKHHNPSATFNKIRYMMIEDKVSGTGLIQTLRDATPVPILPIPRHIDKTTRALDAAPFIQSGRVFIPNDKSFVVDYVEEFTNFSSDDSHDWDDQVDATMDAVQDMLQGEMEPGTF